MTTRLTAQLPRGFRFAGVHAGIKPTRADFALVVSERDAAIAGCFTANLAAAACVTDARDRLPTGRGRAIVLNSGNANALTGDAGREDAREVINAVARALDVSAAQVFAASTGVIGMRLPLSKMLARIPALVAALEPNPEYAAAAIMTTDTRTKIAKRTIEIDGREVVLLGICKGSGMIAPSLATMLAVITTDARIDEKLLGRALSAAMKTSFNALTVDGDMSTNDAVFALANGASETAPIREGTPAWSAFSQALGEICEALARDIAADGEGATKLIEVEVTNAPSLDIAIDLARAVCGSPLVKAAMFGCDPNWGRIVATIGARAGAQGYAIAPEQARVTLQDTVVYDGAPTNADLAKLRKAMNDSQLRIIVDLRAGSARGRAFGCDLSYDYVKINGDYSSLIVADEDGSVKKDDRLTHYSPKFKVSLLVEALSYISKLEGARIVIKYGGAAMVKESLVSSFCEDIALLRSLGVQPIIVHGGGPEITRTLERFGHPSEFVGGMRVTNSNDMRVVEMVLSGSINADIVTMLNRHGAMAFGMSGKDGGLLTAKKLAGQDGHDLGWVGEVEAVNAPSLEMLLAKNYVPVISPVGAGRDGQSYNINADNAAAAIAASLGASKLIYLTDVMGLLSDGVLLGELNAATLRARLDDPESDIRGGMRVKTESILTALAGGVGRVHIIDGRTPHSLIAELFTDNGIGTLVTP